MTDPKDAGYLARVRCRRLGADGSASFCEELLVRETTVELRLDGRPIARVACLEAHLEELAVGHLLGAGLLGSAGQVRSVSVNGRDPVVVGVATRRGDRAPRRSDDRAPPADRASRRGPDLGELVRAGREFDRRQGLYERTRFVHSAALFCPESGAQILREDVGRHNAVDKVVGRAALDGRDPAGCALLTSGRLALEMVAKAARAGFGAFVSPAAASAEAAALACESGLVLLGRVGDPEPIVYGG